MFLDDASKEIATTLRNNSSQIKMALQKVFEASILKSQTETVFLHLLFDGISRVFESQPVQGIQFSTRCAIIHKKPIVASNYGRCELGDLLVVVKYHPSPRTVEAKSIIYQTKLTRRQTTICDIDRTQLRLLSEWPQFSFGKSTYHLQPVTLEFGSYMLEKRNPVRGVFLTGRFDCYGICPDARLLRRIATNSKVDIKSYMYARGDHSNFFSHLAFEIGEPHSNTSVCNMVEALYRYVGLSPDPPDEFEGFYTDASEDGFGVLELSVRTSPDACMIQEGE